MLCHGLTSRKKQCTGRSWACPGEVRARPQWDVHPIDANGRKWAQKRRRGLLRYICSCIERAAVRHCCVVDCRTVEGTSGVPAFQANQPISNSRLLSDLSPPIDYARLKRSPYPQVTQRETAGTAERRVHKQLKNLNK